MRERPALLVEQREHFQLLFVAPPCDGYCSPCTSSVQPCTGPCSHPLCHGTFFNDRPSPLPPKPSTCPSQSVGYSTTTPHVPSNPMQLLATLDRRCHHNYVLLPQLKIRSSRSALDTVYLYGLQLTSSYPLLVQLLSMSKCKSAYIYVDLGLAHSRLVHNLTTQFSATGLRSSNAVMPIPVFKPSLRNQYIHHLSVWLLYILLNFLHRKK